MSINNKLIYKLHVSHHTGEFMLIFVLLNLSVLGPIQTKDARFFRRVLSVPEHSHQSRKTLDAAWILVLL